MPAFSFNRPSCIVTIPISANATSPIHARPWIRRSNSGCVVTIVAGFLDRTARRAGAGAGRDRGGARDTPRAAWAWHGRQRRAAGMDRGNGGGGRGGRRSHATAPSPSLRAARRRAEAERGLEAISPAEGTIERRVSSAASGVRPHPHTGRSGGQMQPCARAAMKRLTRRSSSEWKEIPASTPPSRNSSHAQRQRLVQLLQLVVDGDPQRLERALGGVAAGEARGHGNRGDDRLDQILCGVDRRLLAATHDRAGDRACVALLAEVAQRAREPALIPGGHDLARGQLLVGVHAHVQRRLERVGEPALARVHLHRGHAQVEVDDVGAYTLLGEELSQRLGVAGADEPHGARDLAGQLLEALARVGVAVDRDQRALGTEALGDQLRVAAAAERAVDRSLPGARVEQVDQLAGEHRDVRTGGHVKSKGAWHDRS